MIKVKILTVRRKSINSRGLVDPIFKAQDLFRDVGILFEKEIYSVHAAKDADVLIIDSKVWKEDWKSRKDEVIGRLDQIRSRNNKLVWFDTGDSTGNIIKDVFERIDIYLKGQILRDRERYKERHYGGRIFTDFLHREFGTTDHELLYSTPLTNQDIGKLKLGWNYGLAGGYGVRENKWTGAFRKKIFGSEFGKTNHYEAIKKFRKRSVSMRISTDYARQTVKKQRKLAVAEASRLSIPCGRISKTSYIDEMRQSRGVISPFGWGEIAIRDFECFVLGSVLIKPTMDHLVTFPNYYEEKKTYLPIPWEIGDLEDIVEYVGSGAESVLEIAKRAQERFVYFAENRHGRKEFVSHVISVLLAN
jgi:hypothetical protein